MVNQLEEDKQTLAENEEELARQRQQLSDYEKQAQEISNEQIPERRFGSGITSKIQEQYVKRKEQAKEYIENLKESKESINQYQSTIDSQQAEIETYERNQRAYDRAETYAEQASSTGRGEILIAAYLNLKKKGYDKQYEYFKELYNYYMKRRRDRPTQGEYGQSTRPTITPIRNNQGVIIGYDDPFRGQSRLPTPVEKITGRPQQPILVYNNQAILAPLKYDYPKSINYTPVPKQELRMPLFNMQQSNKDIKDFSEGLFIKNTQSVIGGTYNMALGATQSTANPLYKPLNKILPKYTDGQVLTLPTKTSYGTVTQADITKATKQPAYAFGFLAGQALTYYAPTGYIKYFKTPVLGEKVTGFSATVADANAILKLERSEDYFVAGQILEPVIKDGKLVNQGYFMLKSVRPPVYQEYYPSKFSKLLSAPSRKLIANPRIDISKSSDIIISETGEIINRPTVSTTRKGAKLTYVSEIEGQQIKIDINEFSNLPKQTQLNLQAQVERRIGRPTSLENTKYLLRPEELYKQYGEVKSIRRFRVTPSPKSTLENPLGSGYVYPKGKRTSIGAVTSISKEMESTDIYSFYKGETLVKDITLPKLKKGGMLKEDTKGAITIDDYTLAFKTPKADETGIDVVNGLVQKKVVSPKAIETLKKITAITAKEISNTRSYLKPIKFTSKNNINPSLINSERVLSQSPYYGKGTYERTDGGLLTKEDLSIASFSMPKTISTFNIKSSTIQRPSSRLKDLQVQPSINKSLTNQININKQIEELTQINNIKQTQVQKQNLNYVQKQTQLNKNSINNFNKPNPFRTTRIGGGRPRDIDLSINFGKDKSISKQIAGYRSFVVVNKEKKYLDGIAERGTALRKGESVALKTLRATYGIEKSGVITGKESRYTPSNVFRDYRIKKGSRIPLQDTFIQKRGKRLISSGEVSELLSYRRKR